MEDRATGLLKFPVPKLVRETYKEGKTLLTTGVIFIVIFRIMKSFKAIIHRKISSSYCP